MKRQSAGLRGSDTRREKVRRSSVWYRRSLSVGVPNKTSQSQNALARALASNLTPSTIGPSRKRKRITNIRTEGDRKRYKVSETRYRHCLEQTVYLIERATRYPVYHLVLEPNKQLFGNTKFSQHSNQAFYLVGIKGYLNRSHSANHAIAVCRYGENLYVFDPWGSERQEITNEFGRALASFTGTTKLKFYNGKNLQSLDSQGVCVALSSKLLMQIPFLKDDSNKSVENYFKNNSKNPEQLFKQLVMYEKGGFIRLPRGRSV